MSDWDKILKSFAVVEKDLDKYGSAVMTRLFTLYPYTKKMWTKMPAASQIGLSNDAHIARIGTQVVKKWVEMVKAKGNHINILKPVAQAHSVTHGIPMSYMQHMPATIREVMGEMAGLDTSAQEALKKMMDVIIADMNAIYKELGFSQLSLGAQVSH